MTRKSADAPLQNQEAAELNSAQPQKSLFIERALERLAHEEAENLNSQNIYSRYLEKETHV